MGWTFGFETKSELIQALTKPERHRTVERWCVRGNCLWAVVHFMNPEIGVDTKFITLDLIGKHEGKWGNKSLDETVGPYYFSCPLKYIALVEAYPPVGYAAEWRQRIRDQKR